MQLHFEFILLNHSAIAFMIKQINCSRFYRPFPLVLEYAEQNKTSVVISRLSVLTFLTLSDRHLSIKSSTVLQVIKLNLSAILSISVIIWLKNLHQRGNLNGKKKFTYIFLSKIKELINSSHYIK